MSPVEHLPGSRDWLTEPRSWRDVLACRMGRHKRITSAVYNFSVVSRCSCGALEYDRSGYWMK